MQNATALPRAPRQLGPRGRRIFDISLVLALLAFSLTSAGTQGAPLVAFGSALLIPLLWRRRWPTIIFIVVATLSAVQVFITNSPLPAQTSFPIAVYSVARFRGGWQAWMALAVGLLASVVAGVDWTRGTSYTGFSGWMSIVGIGILLCAATVVTGWALGRSGFTRAAYVASLIDRGEQMAEASAQQARIAAADERVRIAREMHDVVAHGLSVMVVQADGARYAAANDPQIAVTSLAAIASMGRESLTEMRRLLGLLRGSDSGAELAPQPTMGELGSLIEQHRLVGLGVSTKLADVDSIGGGAALTVYRVVQEALTNVRKHAGPEAQTRVEVTIDGGVIDVLVSDDGRGASAPDEHGFGLLGMRERVDLRGGELSAGPAPGGGWLVHARIPQ